ncbi:MAG: TonB-dependent receptor [Bacteroides sp.]|nr:TonB-dependent receptor [Bacteroides sp.]
MKKFLFFVLLIGISSAVAFAQTKGRVTVSGTVIDKEDNSPVMQATVQLLSLPDSTMATGNVTNNNGRFSLEARPGKYVLKVSFVGYTPYMKEMQLTSSKATVNVGKIALGTDAVMLSEAVVTAEAPPVTVSGDTLGYNASAYRTPEGAALEELVRKIPGAEVDDDGNVKLNGKSISKLLVDGKEFFGGDVKTGLQNLPADMVEKISAYDRQSDNARITGIDDGEEEAVLDLTVKKGMNQGWIGNMDAGIGDGKSEDGSDTPYRYTANVNINRFGSHGDNSSQFTLIGRANNVNDMRFGGGGGPRWRRNNGLTASKEFGLNYAMENEKFEFGISARYNYRDNDAVSVSQVENFLPTGNSSFSNSNGWNRNKNQNMNANMRLEWRPDSMTTLFMRGNMSWGDSDGRSNSLSATFNSDPYAVVADPNNYLDFDSESNEELDAIRVNASKVGSLSESKSLSANGNVQLTRKLNNEGRNITLRLIGSYGDSESDRYSNNLTRYYTAVDGIPTFSEDTIRRYITTPTNNYNLGAEVSYSEPLADKVYLQFSYRFQYGYSESDNSTYDLLNSIYKNNQFVLGTLPNDFSNSWLDPEQSKYAEYQNFNHDARVMLRINKKTWRLSAGVAFRPQQTKLSYQKGAADIDTTRNVFNFSPEVDFRYQPQRQTQLRFSYRGRTSSPSMENLLPITDDSNPLNIRTGNPGLKPSFSHNLELRYNTFNMDAQRGVFSHVSGSFTQNSISNIREYNEKTGGWTSKPENINGNWNVFGMFGMNTALKANPKFTFDTFTNLSYANNVGYLTMAGMKEAQKNTTTNLSLGERLGGRYRNDWLEIGLNGSINYSFEKDKLNPENNQEPYTFSYGGNVQIYAPWGTTISTNITNQARRGYSDSNMNRNELIWNAQVAQSFLKGSLTLSLEWNDILREQSNITRSLTSTGRSVYTYNGVNSYGMVRVIYRFNIFGSKEARNKMMQNRGPGFGGPGFGGPGMGGRGMGGGRRPF